MSAKDSKAESRNTVTGSRDSGTKDAADPHVLGSQTGAAQPFIKITIDGVVKTPTGPITGAALHKLAGDIDGYPVILKAGGKEVPNDDEPFNLTEDMEFTTEEAEPDEPGKPRQKVVAAKKK